MARRRTRKDKQPPIKGPRCNAPAGSQERVEAYAMRVANGWRIFHPRDSKAILAPHAREGCQVARPEYQPGIREIVLG